MGLRETIQESIGFLSESRLPEVQAFLEFQRYKDISEMDDYTYLSSIPGMMESIQEGINTPLSECRPLAEVWPHV